MSAASATKAEFLSAPSCPLWCWLFALICGDGVFAQGRPHANTTTSFVTREGRTNYPTSKLAPRNSDNTIAPTLCARTVR